MDTTLTLTQIVQREVERYAANPVKAQTYSIADPIRQRFAVAVKPTPDNPVKFAARIVVMADVVHDKVVILEDTTDKPLYQALMMNGGIPREQIILAYAGETLPAGDPPLKTD